METNVQPNMNLANNNVLQQHENHYMQSYNEQLRIKRDEFIAKRSKEEITFNNWIKCLKEFPPEILEKVPFDVNTISIRSMIPEWYKEDQDEATASAQVANLNGLIEQVNKIIEEFGYVTSGHLERYNELEANTRAKEAGTV